MLLGSLASVDGCSFQDNHVQVLSAPGVRVPCELFLHRLSAFPFAAQVGTFPFTGLGGAIFGESSTVAASNFSRNSASNGGHLAFMSTAGTPSVSVRLLLCFCFSSLWGLHCGIMSSTTSPGLSLSRWKGETGGRHLLLLQN